MIGGKQKRIAELEATLETALQTHRDLEAKSVSALDLAESRMMEIQALRKQHTEAPSPADVESLRSRLRAAESTNQEQANEIHELQQALSRANRARNNSEAGFMRLKKKIARLET